MNWLRGVFFVLIAIGLVAIGWDVRGAKWKVVGAGRWIRPHSAAAIASARDILGRYYGEPVQ